MNKNKKNLNLIILGRVQGVGYRSWMVSAANKYNVSGWVKNLSNGNVEAQVFGEEEHVLKLINECWKGPTAAKVTNIEINNASSEPENGFSWLPAKDI